MQATFFFFSRAPTPLPPIPSFFLAVAAKAEAHMWNLEGGETGGAAASGGKLRFSSSAGLRARRAYGVLVRALSRRATGDWSIRIRSWHLGQGQFARQGSSSLLCNVTFCQLSSAGIVRYLASRAERELGLSLASKDPCWTSYAVSRLQCALRGFPCLIAERLA